MPTEVTHLKELFRGIVDYYSDALDAPGGLVIVLQEIDRGHQRFAVVYNSQKHFRVFAVTQRRFIVSHRDLHSGYRNYVYVYACQPDQESDILPRPGLSPHLRAYVFYHDHAPREQPETLREWLDYVTPEISPVSVDRLQHWSRSGLL